VSRILLAFRAFFGILFHGRLSGEVITTLGLSSKPSRAAAPAAPGRAPDGALQILGILQRDARLIDFLMEDISGYSDDQVGAAVRNLHEQCRGSLQRYLELEPVIDGVEGSFTRVETGDPGSVKFLGNVPAQGRPSGGVLRHKGWRARKAELPKPAPQQDVSIIAPAEIEIE
jgi:hypothetical protein